MKQKQIASKTIINSLIIGARVYIIDWVTQDELTEVLEEAGYDSGEGYSGATLNRERKVLLSSELKKHPLRAYETLIHERLHVIEDFTGAAAGDEGGWEEEFVESIAAAYSNMDVQSGLIDLDNLVIANWDFAAQKSII